MNNLHELHQYDGGFNTFSKIKFNFLEPKVEMVNIEDIARGLAFNPHFNGQSPKFFSIAEHCLIAKSLMQIDYDDPRLLLTALMHDASEAYIGDIIKPLKILLDQYNEIEANVTKVIFDKFNLNIEDLKTAKIYDIKAQEIEYAAFYKDANYLLTYYSPERARIVFLDEFNKLYNIIP